MRNSFVTDDLNAGVEITKEVAEGGQGGDFPCSKIIFLLKLRDSPSFLEKPTSLLFVFVSDCG